MRRSSRAYEWAGSLDLLGGINDVSLAFTEWSTAGILPAPLDTPGVVNPDVKAHRVLMNVDIFPQGAGGGPLNADLTGSGTYVTLGLLETEWDNNNASVFVYDPANNNGNLDAEWLWTYSWFLDADYSLATNKMLSILKPGLRFEFDIPVRRRKAGASLNMKRRELVWVGSSDIPAATGSVAIGLNWKVLLSVPK